MTNTSKGAQETLVMNESRADMTMGPRQTAGASSCTAPNHQGVTCLCNNKYILDYQDQTELWVLLNSLGNIRKLKVEMQLQQL